jgi:hypothetical protein
MQLKLPQQLPVTCYTRRQLRSWSESAVVTAAGAAAVGVSPSLHSLGQCCKQLAWSQPLRPDAVDSPALTCAAAPGEASRGRVDSRPCLRRCEPACTATQSCCSFWFS